MILDAFQGAERLPFYLWRTDGALARKKQRLSTINDDKPFLLSR
jgi:hypothetical protein